MRHFFMIPDFYEDMGLVEYAIEVYPHGSLLIIKFKGLEINVTPFGGDVSIGNKTYKDCGISGKNNELHIFFHERITENNKLSGRVAIRTESEIYFDLKEVRVAHVPAR